jgi:dsRNA-specific ribonuclease
LHAAACDNLGFTPLIITSVRQGNEFPSTNVRAATVGAIVAAVFEDQKEEMISALEKIKDLLNLLAYVHSSKVQRMSEQQTNFKRAHTP